MFKAGDIIRANDNATNTYNITSGSDFLGEVVDTLGECEFRVKALKVAAGNEGGLGTIFRVFYGPEHTPYFYLDQNENEPPTPYHKVKPLW